MCIRDRDSTFLYEYTLCLLEVNDIQPLVALPDLYQEEQVLTQYDIPRVLTHYEKQWLGRGKMIKYIPVSYTHLLSIKLMAIM